MGKKILDLTISSKYLIPHISSQILIHKIHAVNIWFI